MSVDSSPISFGRRYSTRRQFLTRSAVAMAGWHAHAQLASGMMGASRIIPNTAAARRTNHNTWLPEPPPNDLFRELALVAMDVATQAGADFADIRIGVQRECMNDWAQIAFGYGIRARVSGTWSFEHGTVLTRDGVASMTRAAVAGARTAAAVNAGIGFRTPEPIASVPVVTGEWHAPIEVDPFSVPLDDFRRAERLFDGPVKRLGFSAAGGSLRWMQEIRVFASTEGSLVTQSWTRGGLTVSGSVALPDNRSDTVGFQLGRPDGESVGFEVLYRPDYADRLVAAAETAIRWRELPLKSFSDVGRFPVVLDGAAFAAIVGNTLSLALDGDRLSGNESDASGRSFVQPFAAHPIQPPPEFSPLLSMHSHRSMPSSTAVQWDDDGVAPVACTLVDRGTIVDFHTTRETAPRFEEWYGVRHRSVRLSGRALAPTPASIPMAIGGEVHVEPSVTRAADADLYRDVSHGFYIQGGRVDPSPGLTMGVFMPDFVAEIVRGKPVARIDNLSMAFLTSAMLRTGLVAVGDATTVGASVVRTPKGMPWQYLEHPVTAPSARCKEMDVLRTDLSR